MKKEHTEAELEPGAGATPRPAGSDEKHNDQEQSANDFHPIRIKGEPLSVTVLRDRR